MISFIKNLFKKEPKTWEVTVWLYGFERPEVWQLTQSQRDSINRLPPMSRFNLIEGQVVGLNYGGFEVISERRLAIEE